MNKQEKRKKEICILRCVLDDLIKSYPDLSICIFERKAEIVD